MNVKLEISARHCHISRRDLDILFGRGYKLKPIKNISQPGQFACAETISVKTKGGKLESIRIIGPERQHTQVELSMTDCYVLKVKPPIRESVRPKIVNGGSMAELIGPAGKVRRRCLIVAHRHLHLDPKTAEKIFLKNGRLVSIITQGVRSVTFHNVLVRVSEKYVASVHLDLDEANAAGISVGATGKIINK